MAKRKKSDINLALLAGLGALGALAFTSSSLKPQTSSYGPTTVPLVAGTPYLFIVRLEALDDAARAVVESKGATMVEISPAANPPFWAQSGQPFPERVISFRATPAGNSTVMLGDSFYGIGRLERVIRL